MFEFRESRRYIALWLVRTEAVEWLLVMWSEGGEHLGILRARAREVGSKRTYSVVAPVRNESTADVEQIVDRVSENMLRKLPRATLDKLRVDAAGLDAERAIYGWAKLDLTDPDLYAAEAAYRPGAISIPGGRLGVA